MKTIINGKEVKITPSGYLYIDGKKATPKRVPPLQVPSTDITGDYDISLYAHKWAFKHYTMV